MLMHSSLPKEAGRCPQFDSGDHVVDLGVEVHGDIQPDRERSDHLQKFVRFSETDVDAVDESRECDPLGLL
jgi:hypothetical protein